MTNLTTISSKKYFVPAVIFILSFALRLSLISKGPYHSDCLNLLIQAQNTIETHRLHNLFGSGYPLTVILASAAILLAKIFSFENYTFAVNFVSVIFSSAAVLMMYAIAKRIFNETAALLASVMFSVSPMFLGASVYGTSHTICVFFLLLGVLFLLKYSESNRRNHLVWAALSLGLMGAARLQDTILMAVPLSFLYFCGVEGMKGAGPAAGKNGTIRRYLIFTSTAAAVIIFFHGIFLIQSEKTAYLGQLQSFYHLGLTENFMGIFSPRLLFVRNYLIQSLTLGGLIVAILGLGWMFKSRPRIAGFFVLWLIVPCLFYGNLHTTVTPRFFILVLPALILAQAYVLAALIKTNRFVKWAVYAVFLGIVLILMSRILPVLSYRHQHALLPEYAEWVATRTPSDAVIIVTDEYLFIEHYAKRTILFRPTGIFKVGQDRLMSFKKELDGLLEKGVPVYISDVALAAYNWNNYFIDFFNEYYDGRSVGTREYEDWHLGEMRHDVYQSPLYRVSKRY